MSNIFLGITKEERDNILDKHKSIYDGYAIKNVVANEQPLYVQDFANDKEGITVNSKGEVTGYNNKLYMRESKNICPECGLYEEVCECSEGEVEGIGGSDSFDYVENEMDEMWEGDEEYSSEYLESENVKPKFKEKLKESLDMFKRFKKYN